jgi:localization factor PodJL
MWYNLAASRSASGEKPPTEWRNQLAERMTATQLALAQDMARNWRPKPEQSASLDFSALTPFDPSPAPDRKPLSLDEANAMVRALIEVQTALGALGYDPGPADGILGSKTRAAIRAYQAAVGMRVDGQVSNALLALRSSATFPRT